MTLKDWIKIINDDSNSFPIFLDWLIDNNVLMSHQHEILKEISLTKSPQISQNYITTVDSASSLGFISPFRWNRLSVYDNHHALPDQIWLDLDDYNEKDVFQPAAWKSYFSLGHAWIALAIALKKR